MSVSFCLCLPLYFCKQIVIFVRNRKYLLIVMLTLFPVAGKLYLQESQSSAVKTSAGEERDQTPEKQTSEIR